MVISFLIVLFFLGIILTVGGKLIGFIFEMVIKGFYFLVVLTMLYTFISKLN